MNTSQAVVRDDNEGAMALLRRGGAAFTLAFLHEARGGGRWHALGEAWCRPTAEIGALLLRDAPRAAVQAALESALSTNPASRPPRYPSALSTALLSRLGDRLRPSWPLRSGTPFPGSEGGIAALAIAWCRNVDAARAVASLMPTPAGEQMVRMSRLAAVQVAPGDPSAMKRAIRDALQELDKWDA